MSAVETAPGVSRPPWLDDFTAAIDSMDVEKMLPFFASDAVFTFGNNPPMSGHADIRTSIGAFFRSVASLHHTVQSCWQPVSDVVVVEFLTTYTRLDSRQVKLAAGAVFRMSDERIAEYRVYADLAPVFAP
ncbi:nuclear transport factor 2 family protein [Streptomyces krungchingensis]